ncbi:nucleotide sugar dehydrogenase [Planococcus antarcticus DSM 14505]|uniref:GDP-mannose dehydrogenase n=1 Tax=Planococcus antarcticus DSM 14505 TaxID=1185653 RepID=A0A1C7DFD0_9BACL|nr:nucleotide sugar dehydrogenase [Planococcus antarcticus]ANU10250.1 GDP-mannose dehydrogenase [Planococcus antarcticus DSM 14505]EIM07157.1 nucleotide sugar dehydrogenase [Planococcus antarcticus DSM 14505]
MLQNLKIAVVGLGYVGLPIAAAFNRKYPVIGYDISTGRIQALTLGLDKTNEIGREELAKSTIVFTADPSDLKEAGFIIIAVPSAIDGDKMPDLSALQRASKYVGEHMKKGAVVVYESIVAPGMTEELCIPLLEKYSGYESGKEFFVGYSPPRVLAGGKKSSYTKTKKVVAGQNKEVTDFLALVYGSIVGGGIYKAPSIRVAETAKLIESIQLDVNVALMNELAIICERLKIDTLEVLETAGSKRDFVKALPGLVGGQGVELASLYLANKSQLVGHSAEVILSGRNINEGMGRFVAQSLIKKMIQENINPADGRVIVLGLSFKEDVPDLRNSKVIDIVRELKEYGMDVQLADPYASTEDAESFYGTELLTRQQLKPAHAVILAVPHKPYKESGWQQFEDLLIGQRGIVFDVKGVLDMKKKPERIQFLRL